jgi:hypothetical protein
VVWVAASGWFGSVDGNLPTAALLALPAAVAAALIGAALARPVPGGTQVPPVLAAVAGLVVVAALAVPLPRNVGSVEAVIRLQPGAAQSYVEVDLQPPDAAEDASALAVASWQGGGRVLSGLRPVGAGRYVSEDPVPVAGAWKSMVSLQRGDEVMAAPVYLPADPEVGAPAVPALPERRAPFVRNTEILLREAHSGPAWVSWAAYSGLGGVVVAWLALFAWCVARAPRQELPERRPPEQFDDGAHLQDWSASLHRNLARTGG